jgi:biopolymer transport protein ExbD
MAEMDTSSGGGKKKGGVKKGKKLSTRIDLTPMVDLGFLLITFFMFTTTMTKPKTMELVMPLDKDKVKEEDKNKLKASTALTCLLSKNHRVYYYYGIGDNPDVATDVKVTNFENKGGIRDAIIQLKKNVATKIQNGELAATDKPAILIKPDTTSAYGDMVNMLDEMAINDIDIYAIVDISPVDRKFISETEKASGE